ncbi:hypothetical protein [Pseudorhodoplanes sp.]|uniref:hypothetical protein n=1 Tax=Pseudorhodoplanes sp. TaxID=1934341 RepID=UPI003D0B3A91
MAEDEDDLDEIPPDIMRLAQDVSQTWRRCHRKTCKRARGCRGRDVPCAGERPPVKTPSDPEKAARDDARAMAIFQRMLREHIDQVRPEQHAAASQRGKARRRRLTAY